MRKKVRKEYIYIAVAFFILSYLFPYTGDDWAWGSEIGIQRLMTWFDNYSGRYFGNLIVLVLTRFKMLRMIAMTVCTVGSIIIVDRLTVNGQAGLYLICVNMLFLPVVVLRQAVVWTAGFANYATSIFLTLIYIYYTRNMYSEAKPVYSRWMSVPIFVLGICNTLIVEHLTIYNVVLAIYVLVYSFIKFRKIYWQNISYFLGTIIGTVYMFSNSVYKSVSEGTDGYRTIGNEQGIISKALDNFLNIIVEEGFLNNLCINVCLFGVVILVWFKIREELNKNMQMLGKTSLGIIGLYMVLSFMHINGNVSQLNKLIYVEAFATILWIIAIICFVFILPIHLEKKIKLLFILGSAGCMIGPLLVVSPIGSRCFFAPDIMFIYFIMEMYKYIGVGEKKKIESVAFVFKTIALISIIYFLYIYGTIHRCDVARIEKARYDVENGSSVIEVENLPYGQYLWCANPTKGSVWETRFKLFYSIDENIEINNINTSLK